MTGLNSFSNTRTVQGNIKLTFSFRATPSERCCVSGRFRSIPRAIILCVLLTC